MKKFNSLLAYFKLYSKSFILVYRTSVKWSSLLLLAIPLQALIPSATIMITNHILNRVTHQDKLVVFLAIWGLLLLLSNLMQPLTTFVQGQLTDQLTAYLNQSIMRKAKDIESIDFYEDSQFFDEVNLLNTESSWRPVNLLVFGTSLISNIIILLSMFLLLTRFHWLISLALIAVLIPQGYLAYKIQQQAFETLVANNEDSRKLVYYSDAVLTPQNIKEVRLYNAYDFFLKKYQRTFRLILEKVQKNRWRQFFNSSLFLILAALVSMASFFYIVRRIQLGHLPLGSILVFSSSIVYATQSIYRLIEDASLLVDTLLYMKKYFDFMEIENSLDLSGQEKFIDDFEAIHFNHLSFTYPKADKPALHNISFEVKKGEKIAIVGENGSGKSSLIKILLRFYPLKEGSISFDDRDYRQFDLRDYRSHISAVFQDFARFNLTIQENVTLTEKKGAEVAIQQALKQSGFDEGYPLNQELGKLYQNAIDLSGGQWQKLAIARAFFADQPLLILDEPTSAIDAKTEYRLNQRFMALSEGRTVFFITHRLSSVKNADKVLVLKAGELVGFGSHEDLMQTNAYYKEFYSLQASAYQEDAIIEKSSMA